MSKRIAVEDGLAPVQRYLQENGYDVVSLNKQVEIGGCDCCVISSSDENMMGMQDVMTNVPVIDARGMTPEEVYRQVNEKVGQ